MQLTREVIPLNGNLQWLFCALCGFSGSYVVFAVCFDLNFIIFSSEEEQCQLLCMSVIGGSEHYIRRKATDGTKCMQGTGVCLDGRCMVSGYIRYMYTLHMYIHTCKHTLHMCIHTCIHTHTYTHACIHIYITHVHSYMYACMIFLYIM